MLSTTKRMRSDEFKASCACTRIKSSKLFFSEEKNPPVSTKSSFLSLKDISEIFLSLVNPSSSETIAVFFPTSLLKIVDLPTFVLPIKLTTFFINQSRMPLIGLGNQARKFFLNLSLIV